MKVTAARITFEDGTIAATIDGQEWHGIHPKSRFWDAYQEWLDKGNTPDLYVAPDLGPAPRDLEAELDDLKTRLLAVETK